MTVVLQMLGTGNSIAKNYFNNNALLYAGGKTLLVDCGITAPLALHELGKSFRDVDAVLITHIHGDHVGGLEELAVTLKAEGRKMPLYLASALVEPLWDHSLMGGLYRKGEAEALTDLFDVRPLETGLPHTLLPGLQIELLQTLHVPGKDSYSLYINDSVFYSADVVFQPGLLIELAYNRGCRCILHDCQLEGTGHVHATLEELRTLPDDIRPLIRLMHYGDEKPDYVGRTGEMSFVEQHVLYKL